ncbi:hypothetical protein [Corynebacterium aquilae]|uniref:hypothetical protein n=1 Tax=Corynebacterium aquilae TaxID=203263 RepID=UPI00095356DA|nr:hypothetical protein [Corynebacterium aquilae]
MPTPSVSTVATAIATHPRVFHRAVHTDFASRCPQALTLNKQPAAHEELVLAVVWALRTTVADTGEDNPTTIGEFTQAVISQLGTEHRRSDTDPAHYPLFARSLAAGVDAACRAALLPPNSAAQQAATSLLNQCCQTMAAAAHQADMAGYPAYTGGTVVEVDKRCRRFHVIRVQADAPVKHPAGGALAVCGELDPGVWRTLCPAFPANEYGQLEFHIPIPDIPGADAFITTPKVGDRWRIAAPYEPINVTLDSDLLLISAGAGIAPLRAITADVMMQATPPRIHFFVGADYPGELYDLLSLWHTAATSPLLSVVPVVKHDTDTWWVRPSEHSQPPRGLHVTRVGDVGQVAASFGTWEDRNIIVAGAPAEVDAIVSALTAGGTPVDKIQRLELDNRLPTARPL